MFRSRCFSTLALALALPLGITPGVSLAAQSGGGPAPKPAEKDCGQRCAFRKANENLTLEAFYIFQKVGTLQTLADKGDFDKVAENLQQFCVTPKTSQDKAACFNRYKYFAYQRLVKIKTAVIYNNHAMTKLQGEGAAVYDYSLNDKAPIKPYIPSFDEVNAEYKRTQATLQSTIRNDYMTEVMSAQPREEDYVNLVPGPKDPKDAGSQTRMVPDTSCGKPVCFRKNGENDYKKAVAEYKLKAQKLQQEVDSDKRLAQQKVARPKALDATNQGDFSVSSYNATYDAGIKAAKGSQDSQKAMMATNALNFSKGGRALAATASSGGGGGERAREADTDVNLTVTPDQIDGWLSIIKPKASEDF